METITKCIRKYVEKHGDVTSYEVIDYILKQKEFITTEKSVRGILNRVLKEKGKKLKPLYGLATEIRNYVKAHDNEVTSCEVISYIIEEKKFETTENTIRTTLNRCLNEVGGKLKSSYGLTAEIRSYVKAHDNEVTSCEVINYIIEEKKFITTETNIRQILNRILKEVGGKLKPYSKNNCNK